MLFAPRSREPERPMTVDGSSTVSVVRARELRAARAGAGLTAAYTPAT